MGMQGIRRILRNIIPQGVWGGIGLALMAILPVAAQADTVPYNPQTFGPPYSYHTHEFYVPPANSITDVYNSVIAEYKAYYGPITDRCGYPLIMINPPWSNGAVAAIQFTYPCSGGNYIYGTAGPGSCPDGYTPDQPPPNTTTCSRPDVSVNAGQSTIPRSSTVQDRHVLTQSALKLTVTKGGQPDPGVSVTLQSDRGNSVDTITQPGGADANGNAQASVSTREQPGSSSITAATKDVNTLAPGVVTWLPAHYEGQFLITAYFVPDESDPAYINTPLAIAPGVPGHKYHQGFIAAVKIQGSGKALDGSYLHYNLNGTYNTDTCARTASNVCAVDGVTAAADRHIVPLRANVSIEGVGDRAPGDKGKRISGHHIDLFYGTRKQDSINFGPQMHDVDLLSYGS